MICAECGKNEDELPVGTTFVKSLDGIMCSLCFNKLTKGEEYVVIDANKPKQSHQDQDKLTLKHGLKPPKDARLSAWVCGCGKRLELFIPKGKSPICPACGLAMVPAEGLA